MRSSKSRSRGKSSRGRTPANNINRVFDSSGPDGKVRGTPQQIIDKYTQLARDASLANDRVIAENFQQHAEHYTRLLAEALRDAEEKRQQTDQQSRDRYQRDQREPRRDDRGPTEVSVDPGQAPQPDVIEPAAAESGLVETPEMKPKRAPRSRKPRAPKAEADPAAETAAREEVPTNEAPEAAE